MKPPAHLVTRLRRAAGRRKVTAGPRVRSPPMRSPRKIPAFGRPPKGEGTEWVVCHLVLLRLFWLYLFIYLLLHNIWGVFEFHGSTLLLT